MVNAARVVVVAVGIRPVRKERRLPATQVVVGQFVDQRAGLLDRRVGVVELDQAACCALGGVATVEGALAVGMGEGVDGDAKVRGDAEPGGGVGGRATIGAACERLRDQLCGFALGQSRQGPMGAPSLRSHGRSGYARWSGGGKESQARRRSANVSSNSSGGSLRSAYRVLPCSG